MSGLGAPWRWSGRWLVDDDGEMLLAYTTNDDGVHVSSDEAKAVIAAAPELLAALKALVSHAKDDVDDRRLSEEVTAADAAIAKAEGR